MKKSFWQEPEAIEDGEMKIVVLDGYTANPGDCSWTPLNDLGSCEIYDRSAPGEVVERAREAEVLLTNKTLLSEAIFEQLPHLRYVGVLATGYNVVDIEAARKRGIPVCNVPEYSTPNVAQAVFGLLLELTNRTGHHSQTVRAGRWSQCPDFCYWDGTLVELAGRTLGIVGYGRIGQNVARIGQAFGMRVLVHRRQPVCEPGIEAVDLDCLITESDVISLHCPLTPQTQEMINRSRLSQMKNSAFLINTARGGLINELDLAEALDGDRIAGAGLDVLTIEPPSPEHPLVKAKNCVITPHIAWATRDARLRLLATAVENIQRWKQGEPQNVVNPIS